MSNKTEQWEYKVITANGQQVVCYLNVGKHEEMDVAAARGSAKCSSWITECL